MSHVVASCVCRKNMFYNQTSLKEFSNFSTISLTFSIASVIPALLKLFIVTSLSSLRLLYRWTINFTCNGLIIESLRETLTSSAAFPAPNCFDTSLVSYTYSSNEEEGNLHVEVNFDEPIDLAINYFSVLKIELIFCS